MPTTIQMLRDSDYTESVLDAMAELRGAALDAAESPGQVVELLAAQISAPESVKSIHEELRQENSPALEALALLVGRGGEIGESQFIREYGGIRRMGAAKQEREEPWLHPESVAERLYYLGLVGRGFSDADDESPSQSIIYIPSDVLPWLPKAQSDAIEGGLDAAPIEAPRESRQLLADDSLLEDAGTLLGFLHTDRLRLTGGDADSEDLDRLAARLQLPDISDADLQTRLNLLLHIANRLGWLKLSVDNVIELTGNRVRAFLDATRAEQRRMLWDAWRNSPEWNDLCRTPELECTNRNVWNNDPLQTRSTILLMLSKLQPGAWYSQDDVIRSIRDLEPDFQRPDGKYDSWYILEASTQQFLKGFEQWDKVEGALLRYLLRGPLYWLQAVDLSEPTDAAAAPLSLSRWGAHWLTENAPQPEEPPRAPIRVTGGFAMIAPYGTPLADRFRIERFAAWQSSTPDYIFQISQRSLHRAYQEGVTPQRVLEFLHRQVRGLPDKVVRQLSEFDASAVE